MSNDGGAQGNLGTGESMDITALAVSHHATQDYGPLRCVGRFNKAINFLSPHGRLLTLHREGCGLSPMGWEIAAGDFDELSDSLLAADDCQLSQAGIQIDDICIYRHHKRLNLYLNLRDEIPLAPLATLLADEPASTGLFGRLQQIVEQPLVAETRELQQKFCAWLQGQAVDWSAVVGKGPGLTPSNDDTLVGMLLTAHLDSRVDVACLPPFFAASQPLHKLTTLVSEHYLKFAEQGIFSTALQLLARALIQPRELTQSIRDLLNMGHFSGADTLLGIWLGVMTINYLH
ncbi:DUF2877 domain-containing protein [Serratia sp. DD3]|uniref:DUF2877 domain-containing protein n=1 Tax=Serratia sp. DD3 TaxID=1410619 RepID=UPI0003C4ED02|nr:DUF2877 domain-containing protein [Serratia sp. DD3]KEY60498.1 hypothetical protein SRDD_03950 [Serratia sp. DD3]